MENTHLPDGDGPRLRQWLAMKRIAHAELARKMGLHKNTMYMWRNKDHIPDTDLYTLLSELPDARVLFAHRDWKDRYLTALEAHNALLIGNMHLLRRLNGNG